MLEGPSKRYVRDVLRMGPGDSIVLFDGSGMEYPSTIVEASQRRVTLRIAGKQPGKADSPLHIRVGIGLLKANKMDLVIQKITELGVQEVFPVQVSRAVPALGPDRGARRRERWQTIAREASRQCGRSTVTEVGPIVSLDELFRTAEDADLSLLFTTKEALAHPLPSLGAGRPRRLVLLLGPEGGLSEEEEEAALEKGFLPVGLGPRVLRAETAAILAVGLVQYLFGDLGGRREEVPPAVPVNSVPRKR